MKNIFRKKRIEDLLSVSTGDKSLKKVLGAFELTMLGIGAIIGTGIFVLTGIAAANYSGPALVISFIISSIACAFAGLCYAEFAAMVPVAGSAYTYGYAALGEFWAWIIGWDLIAEYAFAISAVAIGWSGYIVKLLSAVGINLPTSLVTAPHEGGIVNLPAVLIIVLISSLLLVGVKQSAIVNDVIVAIKIAVVLLFIALGVSHVNPANWVPFMPYGWSGVISGASVIFFAYIGFDAVSTAAEEVKNPQKDLPIGIIASLGICTVLYIIVSAILTGMVPYLQFKNTSAPVAYALEQVGINWGSALVSVGAVCGITSVLLVMIFGQTRVLFAMSRDGLLPKVFGDVHPKYKTPAKSTIFVCVVSAILAGFTPIGIVAELTNIGTLCAFLIVCVAVIVLRKTRPDLKRTFKCPFVPVVPALGVAFCLLLIFKLPVITQLRFLVWLVVGFAIYFGYGNKNSVMNKENEKESVL
jgi:basic amino acid/polyamine antiporter, APA family